MWLLQLDSGCHPGLCTRVSGADTSAPGGCLGMDKGVGMGGGEGKDMLH